MKNISDVVVGKCPHCEKPLTVKELKAGVTEVGMWVETKIFKCVHCEKIISIAYNKF